MNRRLKLTTTAVEKLRFPVGAVTRTNKPITHFIFWDSEVPGFGVRVSQTGSKVYVYQRRVKGGQERSMTLGKHGAPVVMAGVIRSHAYGADDARTNAITLQAQFLKSIDPIEEARKAEEARRADEEAARKELTRQGALSKTLRQVLEHYLETKRTRYGESLRPDTKADYRKHCEKNMTEWLDTPVKDITHLMCLGKFTEITNRGAPKQANACMVYLRALLNHARDSHITPDGRYQILETNPVTLMIRATVKHLNPEEPSDTRIPLEKVGDCWNWLRMRSTSARTENTRTAADWVSFMLLSGTRRKESGSLRWNDVDFEARTITLHRDNVKTHRRLVIAMSDEMHHLLSARLSRSSLPVQVTRRRTTTLDPAHVFATGGKKCPYILWAQTTFDTLSKIAGHHQHPHAIRRTFEDIALECKVDSDVRRMLINHKGKDVHAVHYANNPKAKAGALQTISQWITAQSKIAAAQASGANVVRFPASRV